MDAHIARLDAIIPTLATREDLSCLESRMTASIGRVEAALHSEIGRVQASLHTEMNRLTCRIVSLLSGLLPAMLAATVYVVKFLP